jgi:sarcosine oxidase subunit alpha
LSADRTQGIITSAAFSPSLNRWISIGFVSRAAERLGERLRAADPVRNSLIDVEVCASCFIDPEGERVRG